MAELKDLKKLKSVFFFCKSLSGKVFGMYNVFLDFFLVKTRIFFFFAPVTQAEKKLHIKYVIWILDYIQSM